MMHCLLLLPLFVGVLCFVLVLLCSALGPISYDVASESEITPFIIYKVMKYRKILIKYNAYLKKAVFHSRENIKSCIFTAVKI